jgi:SNW domain-containing protein 1
METSALPTPVHAPAVPEEEETFQRPASTSTPPPVASRQPVPPYGRRNEWKPTSQEDYGALFFGPI